jgi:hypothetical protein
MQSRELSSSSLMSDKARSAPSIKSVSRLFCSTQFISTSGTLHWLSMVQYMAL